MNYRIRCYALLLGILIATSVSAQQSFDAMLEKELTSLVATYKMLHAAPELSHREENTSAFLAKRLKELGYTVTEHVGKYDRPEWIGYGVVAVLKNGDGPTVLVRSDMDALPVEEKTRLSYASAVKTKNDDDQDVGVRQS